MPTADAQRAKLRAEETAAFNASSQAKADVEAAEAALRNLGRKSVDGVLEPFPPAMVDDLKAAQQRLEFAITKYRAAYVARRAAEMGAN